MKVPENTVGSKIIRVLEIILVKKLIPNAVLSSNYLSNPWTYYQMDLAYRLFNISWDGSSHRGESWEKF